MTLKDACRGLLAGWILMSPPLVRVGEQLTVDRDAPIERWTGVSTHDSEKECEAEKGRKIEVALKIEKRITGATFSGGPYVEAASLSRCIPADDLYPPKRPAAK